jgi:hypothetical protein
LGRNPSLFGAAVLSAGCVSGASSFGSGALTSGSFGLVSLLTFEGGQQQGSTSFFVTVMTWLQDLHLAFASPFDLRRINIVFFPHSSQMTIMAAHSFLKQHIFRFFDSSGFIPCSLAHTPRGFSIPFP